MKHVKMTLCLAFMFLFLLTIVSLSANASAVNYDYYANDTGVVLTKYNGNDKKVVVPSEIDGKAIVKIEGTFYNNQSIEEVILPEGITIIGEQAFYGCTKLKNIILPKSTEIIDDYAFAYCGIKEIILPANTHYINEGAFLGCSNLTAIESHAEPITMDGKALFIGQRAFEDSKIRAIKTKYTPLYYDNSFTGVCHFTDSSINYAIYKSDFLNTIVEPLRNASPTKRALFLSALVFTLALLVFICIYVVRGILMLLGKDKLSNYKKYSKQVFNDMPITKQDEQVINYKPALFVRDKILKVLSRIVIMLASFSYIVFLFYVSTVSTTNNWDMNPFLNATICVLGGVLLSFAAIALVVWLSYKIWSIISDHKEPDIAKVRVRKIEGGNRDDQ